MDWLVRYGFVDFSTPSESPGNRTYPHSFRDQWYSTAAATPLIEAAASGNRTMVALCLRHAPHTLTWRDEWRNSPLHAALERGHFRIAGDLMHPLLNRSPNALGFTPAMLSTRSSFEAAEWAVARGLFDGADGRAIDAAIGDAPAGVRAELLAWAREARRDLDALDAFVSSGVVSYLVPTIRAWVTRYTTPEEATHVRRFAFVLVERGHYASRRTNTRHREHPLFAR